MFRKLKARNIYLYIIYFIFGRCNPLLAGHMLYQLLPHTLVCHSTRCQYSPLWCSKTWVRSNSGILLHFSPLYRVIFRNSWTSELTLPSKDTRSYLLYLSWKLDYNGSSSANILSIWRTFDFPAMTSVTGSSIKRDKCLYSWLSSVPVWTTTLITHAVVDAPCRQESSLFVLTAAIVSNSISKTLNFKR